MLLSLTVVCQAKPWTGRFNVELEQGAGSPSDTFSIKFDRGTLSGNPSDISVTNDHNESGFLPDKKRRKHCIYTLKTPLIDSTFWQLLYNFHLLIVYQLILINKDASSGTTQYSWLGG
ncbi:MULTISPECIES: hypothetical protein [unclassified Endozoicomonas]|uniref:hypothetical protein n=1 Tax=unclassified Endozoicomonas TaxID=2644528 RepID=UPI003BB4F7A6